LRETIAFHELADTNAEGSGVEESLEDEPNPYSDADGSINAEYAEIEKEDRNSGEEDGPWIYDTIGGENLLHVIAGKLYGSPGNRKSYSRVSGA